MAKKVVRRTNSKKPLTSSKGSHTVKTHTGKAAPTTKTGKGKPVGKGGSFQSIKPKSKDDKRPTLSFS
jgi:hypothetical protein